MSSIRFRVFGDPKPKQSFQYGRGHGWTKTDIKTWQDWVCLSARVYYHGEILTCPLLMRLDFYLKEDNGDLDNYCKAVGDALQGVIYKNDKQICKYILTKTVADTPCVTIQIEELKDVLRDDTDRISRRIASTQRQPDNEQLESGGYYVEDSAAAHGVSPYRHIRRGRFFRGQGREDNSGICRD